MSGNQSNANTLYSDIASAYWNEICDKEELSAEEQSKLALLAQQGDIDAQNRLVESCLRLVVDQAKRFCRDFDFFMDLVQAGNIGLIRAVMLYDPVKGCKFSTHAFYWINKYIRNESVRTGHPISIPERLRQVINRYISEEKIFEQIHERLPSVEEMAEIMHMPIEEILELQVFLNYPLSLDQNDDQYSDDVQPLKNKISDPSIQSPEEYVLNEETGKVLEFLMKKHLTETEQFVLRARFGFNNNGCSQTLKDLSKQCGITHQGVHEIEKRAIAKLQKVILQSGLINIDLL